jgi:hypothetical protein
MQVASNNRKFPNKISQFKDFVSTCASTFEEVIKFDTSVAKPGQRQLFARSPCKEYDSTRLTEVLLEYVL